jgi:hypothetical protein
MIGVGTVIYWSTWDSRVLLTQQYVHPKLLSHPAHSPAEAKQFEIDTAKGGDIVYRYVEYCLSRDVSSDIRIHWQDGLIYQMPTVTGVGQKGCFKRAFGVLVPNELAGKEVELIVRGEYQNNPIVSHTVLLPAYKLRVTR